MKLKSNTLILIGLVVFYFITRTVNLKIIPIFTDEAIYSYWAQVALHDPANRFISLEDGKQPLFIWLSAVSQNFIADPLLASRLVSVFAGFGSLIGIYWLSKELFTHKVATLAALLYIILPFTLLHDRLALFDSLLTMLGIWIVFFSQRLAKAPKLDNALLVAATIGAAQITKSSAAFFLYLLPASLIFFDFRGRTKLARFMRWLSFAALVVIFSQLIYNALRLSPLFYIIERKNYEFIKTFSEVLASFPDGLASNFKILVLWLFQYNGPFLIAIAAFVILLGIFKRNWSIIFLSIYSSAPFAAEVIFNKVLFPRFSLFYFPYLIILMSYGLVAITSFKNRGKILWLFPIISLALPLFSSFRLLTDPPKAQIADVDRGQYLNNWPAGFGVDQIVNFIKDKAGSRQEVYVGTEGTFGLLPYALLIYTYGQSNIHITGFWPVDPNKLPAQILEFSQKYPTYFVFNENQKDIQNPHLKLLEKYQKGQGDSYMRLYQVVNQ